MASIEVREEYLKLVGPIGGWKIESVDDGVWTAIVAFLYSDGFITGLDWSTPAGQVFGEMLDNYLSSQKAD